MSNSVFLPIPIQTIDTFVPPLNLNGQNGTNRADTKLNMIDAKTDLEAIQTWLNEFSDSPQTYRNYRKEAERLLLWALIERGKPLSSLNRNDFMAYEAFLLDPQPAERWCGPKSLRNSSQWRPFRGPLKTNSQRQAMIICQTLMTYLVDAGFLQGNPLILKRRKNKPSMSSLSTDRFLDQEIWHYLLSYIESLPQDSVRHVAQYERIRYLFSFLYLLGPRVSEIASHNMASFKEIRGRWWWEVNGKGEKTARIPANEDMMAALSRYREHLGLSARPAPSENIPILLSINGTSGISANMIYRLVKETVISAADALDSQDSIKAAKLRKASTHWFRHTAITHQADTGIELRYLNKSARHTKLETTANYLHAEDDQWHKAMEKHRLISENNDNKSDLD